MMSKSAELSVAVNRALFVPECQRLNEWALIGPVQRAALESFAERLLSAERERCAKPVPDEWLVKVRRLVAGFEHVSGIARLWEPDYSTGSERALWARATEACADVAKLLSDSENQSS